MKFTIDRSKWRTGHCGKIKTGIGPTKLLNHEGYMCCLGFICQQSGCNNIIGIGYPESVMGAPKFLVHQHIHGLDSSPLATKAVEINDDSETTPSEKERLLKDLFQEHEIELEFIGEYPEEVVCTA